MGKYFNRDKFFYGYKAEMVFHETFPEAKKMVNGADYRIGDYLVEIGRSRILEAQIIVYYRKLFYNIKKELHKDAKNKKPEKLHELLCSDVYSDVFIVPPEKFIFIYFTKSLKHFTIFDYDMLLKSELKRKNDGEYFFQVKGNGLRKTQNLYKTVAKRIGYEKPKICMEDFGVFLDS